MKDLVLLIVVADVHLGAQTYLAGIGGQQLVDDFKESGLAGAVVADDGHPFPALDFKIYVCEQGLAVKRLAQAGNGKHILAAFHIRLQPDIHGVVDVYGLFQPVDLIQHLFPALGPADGFFPVKGFKLGNDCLLVPDFLLLI